MSKTLRWLMFFLGFFASPALAQVSGPPHVFVAGTVISPDDVNLNFSTIYAAACNRGGCTMTGNLLFSADNTLDIGASGATRPRDLFLGRNAAIGGTLGVTGATTLAALSATTGSFSSTLGVTGNATIGGTLGVTGATTLAALSATTGSFSSTLAVTGATTLSAALGGTSATFSGTVTGNLFSGSGASLTSIPETAITDGSIFPRLAAAEDIAGTWTLLNNVPLQGRNSGGSALNVATVTSGNNLILGPTNSQVGAGIGVNTTLTASNTISLTTNQGSRTTIDDAGLLSHAYAFASTGTITPSALPSGSTSDYNPAGLSATWTILVAANASNSTLTGLQAQTAGSERRICNTAAAGSIDLSGQDVASAAANRFAHSGPISITAGTCRTVWYDGAASRWRVDV